MESEEIAGSRRERDLLAATDSNHAQLEEMVSSSDKREEAEDPGVAVSVDPTETVLIEAREKRFRVRGLLLLLL
ncbi:hypothetical protein S83_044112 [Arachis hypogaea]